MSKYSKLAITGIFGMMIAGTCTIISSKLALETSACPLFISEEYSPIQEWEHGKCPKFLVKKFSKPCFLTGVVFCSNSCCLLAFYLVQLVKYCKKQHITRYPWRAYAWPCLSGLISVFAITLLNTGMTFVDASISQMWIAVVGTVMAIVFVGLSSVLSSQFTKPWTEQLTGCAIIIASTILQGLYITIQDFTVNKFHIDPLFLVGVEGVFGLVVNCALVWPIVQAIPGTDHGSMEYLLDSFYMVADNARVLTFVLLYFFSLFLFNWSAMVVVQHASSVVRSIFDSVRTAIIWLVNLMIFYVIAPQSAYGERWTTFSWIQMAGFVLLVFSSQCYSGYVKFPTLFKYQRDNKDEIEPLLEKSLSEK